MKYKGRTLTHQHMKAEDGFRARSSIGNRIYYLKKLMKR